MASALYQSIELLSRDKGIEPGVVVGAVEDAIALATRKYYKTQENMRAEMDRDTGEIRAYVYKTVVDGPEQVEDEINQLTLEQARELAPEVEIGGELRFYKDTTPLGRIAAQMAKQVIFQKVREAERDTVFNEYNHRAGEVITATVKRLEPMDVIFDIGKAEASLPSASAFVWSCCASIAQPRARRSLSPAPHQCWFRTCSRARFRRFTTTP
jgi:N utilization substance protein A